MSHPPKRKSAPAPPDADAGTSAKKPRKEKKDKGKGKSKDSASGEFRAVKASVMLAIPPCFSAKPQVGAEEMLDSMIMRYIPALRGVVLSHSNIQFLQSVGRIKDDTPFTICNVGFEAMIWSPEVGMKLSAKINLCSPDHISLLVHRTFNVSIPRHHIPTDQWEFEYGPAENDPDYGVEASTKEEDGPDEPMQLDAQTKDGEATPGDEGVDRGGRWIHKVTAARLGGEDGRLEFTVVGLTIANEMLSLLGSIQPDPFSPEHVPQPAQRVSKSPPPPSTTVLAESSEEEDKDVLAVSSDEAEERQREREKKEKEQRKAEKKRKRKEQETQETQDGVQEDIPKKTKKKK
ncbi:hypothetical protein EWM64_g4790 [Hericium alpestre]|uniref:RPA43 OB domain-containing protein n=1 Tax=Hericium alpestre TaxID=135208 RepID=A0A4Y9ZYE7_9AGAM|nr:hypothetical protein EWM64_g4790 [Hericium alpestre]